MKINITHKDEVIQYSVDEDIDMMSQDNLKHYWKVIHGEYDKVFANRLLDFKYSYTDYVKLQVYTKVLRTICDNMYTKGDDRYLYLLHSKTLGLYKIGVTGDIEQRVKNLNKEMSLTDIKVRFLIPQAAHMERKLHKKFAEYNVPIQNDNGTIHKEWFEISEEIEQYFKNYETNK